MCKVFDVIRDGRAFEKHIFFCGLLFKHFHGSHFEYLLGLLLVPYPSSDVGDHVRISTA